jgi:hypothetical protein
MVALQGFRNYRQSRLNAEQLRGRLKSAGRYSNRPPNPPNLGGTGIQSPHQIKSVATSGSPLSKGGEGGYPKGMRGGECSTFGTFQTSSYTNPIFIESSI